MATLGIDLGNYNVKTSEGVMFPAMYTTKEDLLDNSESLQINGATYYIGCGTLETKLNKAEKQNILPLLYAAILKSTMDPAANIVVGLPASQYKTNRDKLKETLLANKMVVLKYKGIDTTVLIENVEVFPEGAGVYFSLKEKPLSCIVIDIGGGTTNIIHFKNGKIVYSNTLPIGMINIYSETRNYLNSMYTLKLKIEDIEDVLKQGLYVDGEKVNMSFIRPTIQTYLDDLMNELNLNVPVRILPVLLSGGGAFLLYGVLKSKIINITRIENYLYANANGFKEVGKKIWKEEEL